MFKGAHGIVVNNAHFEDKSSRVNVKISGNAGSGLQKLLDQSFRDAFHDASARWPPPKCHFATRQSLISNITDWALGASGHTQSMLWVHGPFGVGKTAVAQTCAEFLASKGKLGASLFFSRPMLRHDPHRLFTSIAYQVAINCFSFSDIIDHKIRQNPTLVTASLPIQFEELLVKPLHQLMSKQAEVDGWVIIVDGLDECEGTDAQCEIINIVATSIREGSTPFRWVFSSRPDPHIVGTMNTEAISSLSFQIEIPVSRDDDHEILLYLTEELRRIGQRHRLPTSWPPEADIAIVVDLAGGLWQYAATVIRFIGNVDPFDPAEQLDAVVSLAEGMQGQRSSMINPLAEMDELYTLILERVRPNIRSTMRKILLLNTIYYHEIDKVSEATIILDLSNGQYRSTCSHFQSVLTLEGTSQLIIKFHHASFMEFMTDPKRSKENCIYGDTLAELRKELIRRLNEVHHNLASGQPEVSVLAYYKLVASLLLLLRIRNHPLDFSTATALLDFDFPMIPRILQKSRLPEIYSRPRDLKKNIPEEFRDRIIKRSKNPLHLLQKPVYAIADRPYILGYGKNSLVCWRPKTDPSRIVLQEPLKYRNNR